MATLGETKKVDGRTLEYVASSKTPGTYYWRTLPTNAPKASAEEIQTRNLASTARQTGGDAAATRVYQAAGYTGVPDVSTRPTTFDITAARAAVPTVGSATPTIPGQYAGMDMTGSSGALSNPQDLQSLLLSEIKANQPTSFADELAKKVNALLQESTKGMESLRGDIVAGQAQRLTTPDQFIMGKGYSPSQINQLKQPEELGARARLAALDDRIATRQSQIDKAVDSVGKMEGERRNTNIKLLETMIEQQRYDQEQSDKAKKAQRDWEMSKMELALNLAEGQTASVDGEKITGLKRADEPTAEEKLDAQIKGYTYVDGEYVPSSSAELVFKNVGNESDAQFDQCGYFSNRTTDGAHVGDSWESKLDAARKNGTVVSASKAGYVSDLPSIKAGNTLVIPLGKFGHTAVVTDYDPETGTMKVVERNKNLDGQTTFGEYNLKDLQSKYAQFGIINSTFKSDIQNQLGISGQSGGQSFSTADIAAIGKVVYGTRISDKETPIIRKITEENPGKSRTEIIMNVLGFNPSKNLDIAKGLMENIMINTDPENGIAGFDFYGLTSLLNANNTVGAIRKVENFAYGNVKKVAPDSYIDEALVSSTTQKANTLMQLVDKLNASGENPVGNFKGTIQDWLGRFKSPQAQAVATQAIQLIKDENKRLLGSTMTESEREVYSPITPSLTDSIDNFKYKVTSLKSNPLINLNALRSQVGLPELNEDSLINLNLRQNLYSGSGESTDPQQNDLRTKYAY